MRFRAALISERCWCVVTSHFAVGAGVPGRSARIGQGRRRRRSRRRSHAHQRTDQHHPIDGDERTRRVRVRERRSRHVTRSRSPCRATRRSNAAGIRIGTQQFLTLDLTMEVGAIAENVTVTGQSPIIETSNASQGTVLDSAALQTLPSPGRTAFMIGTTVPTVIPSGDTQFNRQQDQTNASLLSLGGGTRRGNNYTLDGVPITDMRNRAVANPTIEALDDVKVQVHTYDAEMGAHRRRRVQHDAEVGHEQLPRHRLLSRRVRSGLSDEQLLQRARAREDDCRASRTSPYYLGGGGFGGPIIKNRTFFWFATRTITTSRRATPPRCMPTAARARRRFLGTTNAGRRARHHLRSADAAAVPRQRHSGEPHQPGGRRRC